MMPKPHKREFTDEFIEGEYYRRFMASAPEVRRGLLEALKAADKLARLRFDSPVPTPLFDQRQTEAPADSEG